jgi:hypothetical protein
MQENQMLNRIHALSLALAIGVPVVLPNSVQAAMPPFRDSPVPLIEQARTICRPDGCCFNSSGRPYYPNPYWCGTGVVPRPRHRRYYAPDPYYAPNPYNPYNVPDPNYYPAPNPYYHRAPWGDNER